MVERTLEITTMIGCPLMCTFCPQDKLQQAYKSNQRKLTLDTYNTVLDKLPQDVHISFAGYTEPWANKLCNQFVKIALEKKFKISIYTTLYNITVDECDELATVLEKYHDQVTDFWIHLPDAQGNMLGFRYSAEYDAVLSRIKSLRNIKVYDMTMDSESKIQKDIKTTVYPVNWYLHTRANNLDTSKIQHQPFNPAPKHEYIVECTRNKEYHSNVLLPNGDVILCCMDYSLKHVVGNLLTQSYDEILNSAEIDRVSKLNNTIGFTADSLCKSCNDGFCHTPWNNQEVYERVKALDPDRLGL